MILIGKVICVRIYPRVDLVDCWKMNVKGRYCEVFNLRLSADLKLLIFYRKIQLW